MCATIFGNFCEIVYIMQIPRFYQKELQTNRTRNSLSHLYISISKSYILIIQTSYYRTNKLYYYKKKYIVKLL